jgi:hypothetical protein
MNTKDKNYKEWLRLNKKYREIPWTVEPTKEEAELDRLLENPRFRKFGWYQQGKNINMIGCDYDENPHEADWFGFLGGWESEYIEYRYHHKNSAKWDWW